MALSDLLKNPLDTTQADAQAFMERVQGNILKGHARAHTAQVFMALNSHVAAARAWIAGALSNRLTSAQAQDEQMQQYRTKGDLGEPFFAFFLSYQSYLRLGIADSITPPDAYFRAGMKASPAGAPNTVTDPRPRFWDENVKAFRTARDALALMLGVTTDEAAALAVGRHRDGRPVMPATTPQPGADANDFNFKGDAEGAVCPFQAHIRKTNPRGDIVTFLRQTDEFERSMRILRRGITFGERPDLEPGSNLPPPETGVGLLFMCYQSQLRQFVIQQEGADGDNFVTTGVGPDATLGNNATNLAQQWPAGGQPNAQTFRMANFVTMLSGEYFFAPSLSFLATL